MDQGNFLVNDESESENQSVVSDALLSFVTPWTVAHQDPQSMGILHARILVVIHSSRGSSQPRD